jgi:hypothetical protein
MTKSHIQRMIDYNTRHADVTKNAVLNILRFASPISPHEIELLLYSKAKKKAGQEYEKGKISDKELNIRIKENSVDIRTVHRKLAALIKDGLAERKNGKYSLTIKAKSDIRYFATEFANGALYLLMGMYFPHIYTGRQNIEQLVRLFGTYILFCFIETARPIRNITDTREKERLVYSCLDNIVPLDRMYRFFLAVLDYGLYNDGSVIKHEFESLYKDFPSEFQNLHKALKKGLSRINASTSALPSAFDLSLMRVVRQSRSLERAKKEERLDTYFKGKSWDELDADKLRKFGEDFKKTYHKEYPQLYTVLSAFNNKSPKQRLVDIMETWPTIT